jgi:heptosyltransferase-2
MAAPMMASLAQTGPLDVACLPHLADLFQGMPYVRRVLPMAFARGRLQWFERRRHALGLIDAHYQQAIVCPNSWKSALLPWFANIPQRTGLVGEWRYGLLNDIRRPRASPGQSGVNQPALYASLADDAIAADALGLQQAPLLLAQPADQQPIKPQLALCPGAEYGPAKQWPVAHYAQLASEWLTAGGQIVVLGGPKDQGIGEAIVMALNSSPQLGKHQSGDCRMLAGQTSLAQAMTELASSALVVSNDSGLMHVAAALGRPCLGLYGSTRPGGTELGRQDLHVTRQHHQVDLSGFGELAQGRLLFNLVVRRHGQVMEGKSMMFDQTFEVGVVRRHPNNFNGQGAVCGPKEQVIEALAVARDQNQGSGFFLGLADGPLHAQGLSHGLELV